MLRVYEHSFHTLTSRKKESLRVLRHSCYSASMSGPVLEKAMVDGGYRISREHLKIRTATTYAKRLMNVFQLLVVTADMKMLSTFRHKLTCTAVSVANDLCTAYSFI